MPKKEFALDPGGPKRLKISWSGIWKNIDVRLDERSLGVIENQAALKQGRDFPLGDGTTLHVQLVTGFANAELQVTRDGAPLPGSGSDPEERLKAAWGIIFFVAGLNAVLGFVVVLFDVQFLANIGLGWYSILAAAIYAGLGFAVKSYRSSLALGIAVFIFAADGLLSLGLSVAEGGNPPIGGIIARIFFILPMIRGFAAIKELRGKPATIPAVDIPDNVASRGQPWEPPRRG